MNHVDRAEEIYLQNYNCAQAVFGAFAEEHGLDFDTAMRVAFSLGGGLGGTGEVCGAALGMCLAVGLAGAGKPDAESKKQQSERVKRLMEAFAEKFGATGCNALRVVGDRSVCAGIVRYAAQMTERSLKGDG